MKRDHIFLVILAFGLLLSACGPQGELTPTAALIESTPEASSTPSPTPTSTLTPTPTLAPTPLPPMVVVGGLVPCYSEPGTEFSQVAAFNVKMDIEVLGKNDDETFLMVKAPEDGDSCWIESQYATWVVSEIAQMAEIVPTATSTPLAPSVVENFKGYGDCQEKLRKIKTYWVTTDQMIVSMVLTWDGSPVASGYRIYKDLQLVKELSADQTKYVDSWLVDRRPSSGQHNYGIQVYNSSGESEIITITVGFTCKP